MKPDRAQRDEKVNIKKKLVLRESEHVLPDNELMIDVYILLLFYAVPKNISLTRPQPALLWEET